MKVTVEFDTEIREHRELLKEWLDYSISPTVEVEPTPEAPMEPPPEPVPSTPQPNEKIPQTHEELATELNRLGYHATEKKPVEGKALYDSLANRYGPELNNWSDEQLRIGITEIQALLRF